MRDTLPELSRLGVDAVGISPDPPEKLKRFDDKKKLGFLLLSDENHETTDAYGAWGEKTMFGKKYKGFIRSSFLVDEKVSDV